MFRIILLIIGVIGLLLSLCVVGVSLSLPIINGPRTSWSEAMMGVVPGSICCALFFFVATAGLILVLTAPKAKTSRAEDDEDDEDEKGKEDDKEDEDEEDQDDAED